MCLQYTIPTASKRLAWKHSQCHVLTNCKGFPLQCQTPLGKFIIFLPQESQNLGEKTLGKQHQESGLLKADAGFFGIMSASSIISWHLFYRRSCLIGSWEFREIELQPSWRCVWEQRGCQGLTYPKGQWLPAADKTELANTCPGLPGTPAGSDNQLQQRSLSCCVLLANFLLRIRGR